MNIIIGLWTAWAVMSLVVLSNQGKVAAANFSAPSFIAMLIVTGIYFSIRAITKKTKRSLSKTQQSQFNSGINDAQLDEIYEQVALEMKEGRIKDGVMTRAIADSDGDKNKAEATYIKLRVQALRADLEAMLKAKSENSQPPVSDQLHQKPKEKDLKSAIAYLFRGALIAILGLIAASVSLGIASAMYLFASGSLVIFSEQDTNGSVIITLVVMASILWFCWKGMVYLYKK
ncbi:hypothetical protein QWY20_14400 [Alkalimonas sp. MEB108]|uniref:MotA/TolQ/ExbB proton channel domain-containing protein n=1 Tax=Alkalimonas cellulosilytica TaxID=3058395 RepID=A0ABU7J9G8_9GAMM|nr:hypothetical protein [Alkalimonas sp. MEB108]MEE2002647.1 hypothetical protein [Alkalimonas sp. MEB108]